jgi:tRNA-2-methylthio-N6-dimethylallyladenosine synthase
MPNHDTPSDLQENAPRRPSAVRGVYLQTFGCQMNEYDSSKLLEQLQVRGYRAVERPEQADLVLVNTCAIREKSEHKVDSLLGTLALGKAERPGQVIGVTGCVAQERGGDLLKRNGAVDFVLGTDALFQLPDALRSVEQGERVAWTDWNPADRGLQPEGRRVRNFVPTQDVQSLEASAQRRPAEYSLAEAPWLNSSGEPSVVAHLAITKGCDNFCTFCIVPYTRGREVSREPLDIIAEAKRLVARGVKEITLLGQNVNSYNTGGTDFVGLLERLATLPGLARLRYTSPHPKDFSPRLAQAHRDLSQLCEHLHLPLQSGSDRILKAMRRNHAIQDYIDRIAYARALVPQLTVTTDLIVGFPGETEADFEATLSAMRTVQFDQVYAFKFSPRAQTPAAEYAGQVSEGVKAERLERLFALHEATVRQLLKARVGSRQEVLVEGPARVAGAVTGRTRGNTQTTVPGCTAAPGTLLPVEIAAARRFALTALPLGQSGETP